MTEKKTGFTDAETGTFLEEGVVIGLSHRRGWGVFARAGDQELHVEWPGEERSAVAQSFAELQSLVGRDVGTLWDDWWRGMRERYDDIEAHFQTLSTAQGHEIVIAEGDKTSALKDQVTVINYRPGVPVWSNDLQEFVAPGMTAEELEAALRENIRLGYLEDNGDGTFIATEEGKRRAELMASQPTLITDTDT